MVNGVISAVKLSVVIPTKNEEKDIGDCLRSLSRQKYRDFD
ncbi:MAG: glycosyltransferase, partial [Candidatus Aenigmarchaeota archaeon]|nr:glycosyltransferase [Candidatus Aenigmarchaeota archaeon]